MILPIVSDYRDYHEVTTGKDLITNDPITGFQYKLTVLGAAVPFVGGAYFRDIFGSLFKRFGKAADDVPVPATPSVEPDVPVPPSGSASQGLEDVIESANDIVAPAGTSLRPSGRAPEFYGGKISEAEFLRSAEDYLGPGYREVSPGRYISADGMRQVRFGAHETRGPRLHAHFEAFDKPYGQGGRIIENTTVDINPD